MSKKVIVFPSVNRLGSSGYRNEYTNLFIDSMRANGLKVIDFTYLRAFFSTAPLIINWPEYFGYSRSRFGTVTRDLFSLLMVGVVILIRSKKYALVMHNMIGQRFSDSFSQMMLRKHADKIFVINGSPRISASLEIGSEDLPHPRYEIVAEQNVDRDYGLVTFQDPDRQILSLKSQSVATTVRRSAFIPANALTRTQRHIFGPVCEKDLQHLILNSSALIIPWVQIANSGLAHLASQLGTQVFVGDQEFAEEARSLGLDVNPLTSLKHLKQRGSKDKVVERDYADYNNREIGAPIFQWVESVRGVR